MIPGVLPAFPYLERGVAIERAWHHTHAFEDADGGTRMTDRVRYRLPLGPLGELAHPVFVRRTLERIFDFRRDRIARLLAAGAVRPARAGVA